MQWDVYNEHPTLYTLNVWPLLGAGTEGAGTANRRQILLPPGVRVPNSKLWQLGFALQCAWQSSKEAMFAGVDSGATLVWPVGGPPQVSRIASFGLVGLPTPVLLFGPVLPALPLFMPVGLEAVGVTVGTDWQALS